MSSGDDAAAKRAAAAEARRQKILARGAERLSRITVGTPIDTDASEAIPPDAALLHSPKPEVGHTDSDAALSAPEPVSQTPTDGALDEQPQPQNSSEPLSSTANAAAPELRQESNEAALHSAQREAEQALHSLLNQLAGPSAGQLFAELQSQTQIPDRPPSQLLGSEAARASGRTVPPNIQTASRGGSGDRTEAAGTGPTGRRVAGSAPAGALSRALHAAGLAVAALLAVLLGPQLTAAVEATRRLRCLAAVALAALLCCGVVEVGHLRGVPPVVVLLLTQVALIAAARGLGVSRPMPRVRSFQQLAGRLGADDSVDNLAAAGGGGGGNGNGEVPGGAGGGGSGGGPPEGFAAATGGLLRSDWLALVPGLRPLIDRVSSAGALVSGLYGDVAVFLVSYVVLGAGGQLGGWAERSPR